MQEKKKVQSFVLDHSKENDFKKVHLFWEEFFSRVFITPSFF